MAELKKCFTINQNRTTNDFEGYRQLLKFDIFQGIEIFFPYNHDEDRKRTYAENVMKLKKEFPNVEVVMHLPHGPSSSLCNFENYKEIIQRMKDGMDFTSVYQTKKLTLHLGQVDKNIDRQVYVDHIIPVLQELCDYAKKYQMNIMIENMPASGELGYSPDEIEEIIVRTNRDNLKFILDTGHAHVSEYSVVTYIRQLKNYLMHMHFSDNDGSRDAHTRMGSGTIDFELVFSELAKIGYNQLHCLEVLFNEATQLIDYASDLGHYEPFYEK